MDRNTWRKDGLQFPALMAGGVVIYAGHIVCANADGFAEPGGADATLVTLGVSEEMADSQLASDGGVSVLVSRGRSFCLANSTSAPVTQAHVGRSCYVEDSVTVSAAVGTPDPDSGEIIPDVPEAGKVLEVTSHGVWVFI